MKQIPADRITETVRRLCIEANRLLPDDLRAALARARADEPWPIAAAVLEDIIENYRLAEQTQNAICQDTGLACVFVELGQEVAVVGGDACEAIHEGVRQGYTEGYLRKSTVTDPLFARSNPGDNTPAVITWELVPGDALRITVAPKGAGSENMSRIAMLKPADGVDGVRAFVLETVRAAGSNPCPPIVVGVGLGGTFDRAALLAKRALLRPVDLSHPDPRYAALERELLESINALGIGPQGFGGKTTALGVSIETAPTHIAMLPCAVNIGCHVTRHRTALL
ncbi:MAG: fumarate hydratase [Oscillospiraceae bacterium]